MSNNRYIDRSFFATAFPPIKSILDGEFKIDHVLHLMF